MEEILERDLRCARRRSVGVVRTSLSARPATRFVRLFVLRHFSD